MSPSAEVPSGLRQRADGTVACWRGEGHDDDFDGRRRRLKFAMTREMVIADGLNVVLQVGEWARLRPS